MKPGRAVIAMLLACCSTHLPAQSREGPPPPAPDTQEAGAAAEPATTQPAGASAKPKWLPKHPGPWNAALHLARSKDGKTFEPSDKPIIGFAAAPTLARLQDGRLLAVFEHYSRADQRDFGRLALAISKDDGKTWTEPKPLDVRGLPRRVGRPRGPALAVMPEGHLRLVFSCTDRRDRQTLFCAESREDLEFRMRGRLELQAGRVAIDDPAVLYIDQECHLFGTAVDVAGQRCHAVAKSGRRFKRLANIHASDAGTQGCALAVDGGYRFYATSPAGILSATSADAKQWTRDEGLRITGGEDPAVARIEDGSFLMLYVKSPPGPRTRRRDTSLDGDRFAHSDTAETEEVDGETGDDVAEVPEKDWWFEAEDAWAADDTMDDLDALADDLEPIEDEEAMIDDDAVMTSDDQPGEDGLDWDDAAETPGTAVETDADVEGEVQDEGEGEDDDAAAESPEGAADDLPDDESTTDLPEDYEPLFTDYGIPVPDFKRPVDYRRWLEDRHDPDSVEDNAYYYYAAFMLDADGRPLELDELPSFQCMLNDADFDGPPAPWDPEHHPEWEESYHATEDLTAMYAEASTHSDYVRPLVLGSFDGEGSLLFDGSGDNGDELLNNLMINMLLPDLSAHRRMVKQTVSRAWRAEDGKLDPDAMIEAFDTSLGSAGHVVQGDTLIEMLVGIAERFVVEKHARWALQHDVFSAEEMEATLDVLVERDEQLPPVSQWMTGELAMSLDMTQYLFGPIEKDREPTLNPERIEKFNKMFGGEVDFMTAPTPEEIAATTTEGVIDNFIEYNRTYSEMVERGYPEVRAADLDEMTPPYVEDNYLSRILMPSLSRVYQLTTRQEASRRATQLTYAIHLHQEQTGEWPASLDDLPPHYADDVRIDPFSGDDFAYRLTEDGFTLYSTSENGTDDGGTHNRRWGDTNKDDSDASDDFVFWPPTKR